MNRVLAVIAVVSLLGFAWAVERLGRRESPRPDPAISLAVVRHRQACDALFAARDRIVGEDVRRELASTDPDRTGLVGIEWSPTTTTQGSLEAKQLSARPEWVGVFADWYREAGARPGDAVAISASGSFPGMVLSARLAAEALGLEPRCVGSLTASNYGANVPGFDLLEMDRVLVSAGILSAPLADCTPGGEDDLVRDLEPEVRNAVIDRLAAAGYPSREDTNFARQVDTRSKVLLGGRRPCLLVNVGGNAASEGTGAAVLAFPTGRIVRPGEAALPAPSVIAESLEMGIPVISILNVRAIALERGLVSGDISGILTGRRLLACLAVLCALGCLVWHRRRRHPPE